MEIMIFFKDGIIGHGISDERGCDHLLFPRSGAAVVSRYPSGKDQDGFPITNVGNDNSFRSYPQVVPGSHLKMDSRLKMAEMTGKRNSRQNHAEMTRGRGMASLLPSHVTSRPYTNFHCLIHLLVLG